MKRVEFDPEKLRIVGRLSWMKDGDEGHWFSIPSSNDQLIFSEEGIYAHSLTGMRIEIFEILPADYSGRVETTQWTGRNWCESNPPPFSELLENGEDLHKSLVTSGVELWSSDPDAIFQWTKTHVVILDESNDFAVISRKELQHRVRAEENWRQKRRELDAQHKEKSASYKANREAQRAAKQYLRSRPGYDEMFASIYGKSQDALGEDDPYGIVYAAHCVTEFRLKIGKWAPPMSEAG